MTSSGGNCSIKIHPGRFFGLNSGELPENGEIFALDLRLNRQIKYNFGGECFPLALSFWRELFYKNNNRGQRSRAEAGQEGFVFNVRGSRSL